MYEVAICYCHHTGQDFQKLLTWAFQLKELFRGWPAMDSLIFRICHRRYPYTLRTKVKAYVTKPHSLLARVLALKVESLGMRQAAEVSVLNSLRWVLCRQICAPSDRQCSPVFSCSVSIACL